MNGLLPSVTHSACNSVLSLTSRRQTHKLHAPERDWPQTNCYVDLWIELVAALDLAPEAMLGFTLTQNFDGDQFTFFKPPHSDLEFLYGIRVEELALYDRLDTHIETQIARGRIVVVEVDGHYLPDTRGVTYRLGHSKTTVGITRFDPAVREMDYFHNDGFFSLEGEDFDGVLGRLSAQTRPDALFPYAEFVRLDGVAVSDLRPHAEGLLRRHFARRPEANPFAAFASEFPRLWAVMENRPEDFFHKFAFNTVRQFGANFELLGSHLDWLAPDGRFAPEAAEARAISSGAKALQFNIARAMARKRAFDAAPALEEIARNYDRLFVGLEEKLG